MIPDQRAGAVVVAILFAAAPAAAADHDDDHHGVTAADDAARLDPRAAEVAQRLWKDVVCLCGRCERLTLSACHCPDAATERKKVVDLLRGHDLTSPATAEVAYQTVLKEYAAGFRDRHVLAAEQSTAMADDLAAVAAMVGIVAAACVAVAVIETRRRGRRRSGPRLRR